MSKTIHVSMSVRGALRNSEWLSTLIGNYFRDGKKLTDPEEIFADLCNHLKAGHEVIPFGEACDNYDWKTGCQGHSSEVPVTIDGLSLTTAEVMTLRVAVTSFLMSMGHKSALGDDDHAKVMRESYRVHGRRIEKLLIEG